MSPLWNRRRDPSVHEVQRGLHRRSGEERHYDVSRARQPKSVMVVGGGPAGMEAARVAAKRGHAVFLYEKEGSERLPKAAGRSVAGPKDWMKWLATSLPRSR